MVPLPLAEGRLSEGLSRGIQGQAGALRTPTYGRRPADGYSRSFAGGRSAGNALVLVWSPVPPVTPGTKAEDWSVGSEEVCVRGRGWCTGGQPGVPSSTR